MRLVCVLVWFLAFAPAARAGEVMVAVASNFVSTAEAIVEAFEAETDHDVILSHGSTGQIYAQVAAGAPFDVFLAADRTRPALLKRGGLAEEVETYAIGRLALVSTVPVSRETAAEAFAGRTVALADPTVAPYGLASTSAMENLDLDTATFRPVLVANVGQVATLFVTGNADLAFVSDAQVPLLDAPYVMDLAGLHPPVVQDAALLTRAGGNEAARAFWDWLFSDAAREVIAASGYDLP